MSKTVKIIYDENVLQTTITIDGKIFDTSRISGKNIEDWLYPFVMCKIKWNGIFEELSAVIGNNVYTIIFSGSNTAMKFLMQECPETVNIIKERKSNSNYSVASMNEKEYSSLNGVAGAIKKTGEFIKSETGQSIIKGVGSFLGAFIQSRNQSLEYDDDFEDDDLDFDFDDDYNY